MRMLRLTVSLTVLFRISLTYAGYLRGKHLRIGYFETPPDVFTEYDKSSNTTTFRGVMVLMLQWMAARESFTYFTSNLILHLVVNNFIVRHGRNLLVHFLQPYSQEEHVVIIPSPKDQANVWSVLWPYTWKVWLCLCLSGVAIIFFLSCATRIHRTISHSSKIEASSTFSKASTYVIGIVTNQGNEYGSSKALVVRILAGTWCLASVVLVNAFSSSLITYLTVPTITPLVTALRDLANKTEPQILTRPESFLRMQFETNPAYAPYRDNVLMRPRSFCGKLNDAQMANCLSLVRKGGHVLAMEGVSSRILLSNEFRKTRTCDLTFAEEPLEKGYAASVIPLSSSRRLRNALDFLILHAISSGLMEKWRSEFIPKRSICSKHRRLKEDGIRQLTIKDLGTAFVVLLLGIGLSAIAFVCRLLI